MIAYILAMLSEKREVPAGQLKSEFDEMRGLQEMVGVSYGKRSETRTV
jgi:hypothetical protein